MGKLIILLTFVVIIYSLSIINNDKFIPMDIRWQVENAQYTYNRDLDRLFSLGYLNAWNAKFNESLDKLMESFCSGKDFISWNSFYIVLTTISTFQGTRYKYADLSINLFQNASRHIVSNRIVIPYIGNDGRMRAQFNASTSQISFAKQADGKWKPTQGWGYYHNTWLFNNEKWCMQKFFADTIVFMVRPDDQLPYFITDPNIL